ncbi:MAG: DUF6512 family protein [Bacillota bacterium]
MESSKRRWLITAILAAILGCMLHFIFDLLSGFTPVGIIGAVNESVWEHMKLAFWPMLVLGALAGTRFGYSTREWAFPLAEGITVSLFAIPLGYYFIECGLGIESVIIDIVLFFAAVFVGFGIIERTLKRDTAHLAVLGWFVLAVWAACFIIFTFFPLHLPLFFDSSGAFYGMPH